MIWYNTQRGRGALNVKCASCNQNEPKNRCGQSNLANTISGLGMTFAKILSHGRPVNTPQREYSNYIYYLEVVNAYTLKKKLLSDNWTVLNQCLHWCRHAVLATGEA